MLPLLVASPVRNELHTDEINDQSENKDRIPSPRYGSWRVRASVTIPTGITAGPYPSELMLGANTRDHPKGDKYIQVKVKYNTVVACPDMDAPLDWLLHMTPARDRHEQNVEATRDAGGRVAFRIIKDIQKGQELLVWYSAELAMECNIPVLTPANISRSHEYACTSCDVTFHYPNTLKAHIRFHCTRKVKVMAEQYLRSQFEMVAYQQQLSQYVSHLRSLWGTSQLTPPAHICSSSSQKQFFRPFDTVSSKEKLRNEFVRGTDYHNNSTHTGLLKAYIPLSEGHNFPTNITYIRGTTHPHGMTPDPCVRRHGTDTLSHQETVQGSRSDLLHSAHFLMPSEAAGEPIDLLPKSAYLNSSIKGHLCIYCGKLYSRKYGLKIHLRTHTGYKPLKCKICLRPFGDPSNLNKHIRLHAEGDTPYRCEHCGKVLVRRRDLERHIKSRHPQHSVSEPNDTDDASDALADADNSFIDVDINDDDDTDMSESTIDMSCDEIEVL